MSEERPSEAARRGFLEGLRESIPIIAGYLPASVAFGVAARGAGLNLSESVVMSLMVYSGASQFAIVGLMATGASWLVMAAISLVLGARHVLYGPSLAPYLRRMSTGRAATAAFGLTDEVFAVASVKLARRPAGLCWLVGLEIGAYLSWALGTWIGSAAGTAVVDALPSLAPALSFGLPALFATLLVSFIKQESSRYGGASDPLAGAVFVAAVAAAALSLAGLGSWSVPAAGVTGPVVGLLLGGG